MRGFELGTETDRMFADAEQKRAEREVGKTEFQQVVDASGVKPMTPQQMLYTSASVAPISGDIIAYKEAPEDFERAYELMQRGYKEKDLVNLGLGAAFAGLVTLGLVPGIGFISRIGKNAAKDSIKNLLKEGNLDKAADTMVNTSKVFNDKALTSKKAEKQLKDLARAKIKLNNMTGKKTSEVDLLHAELPKEKLGNIDSQEYSNIINDLSKDVEVKTYLSNKYDNSNDSIEVAFPENFRPKNEIAAMTSKSKPSPVRQLKSETIEVGKFPKNQEQFLLDGDTVTLYHGTSKSTLPNVLKSGLRGDKEGLVYTSPDVHSATGYGSVVGGEKANIRARRPKQNTGNENRITLKYEIPKADFLKLVGNAEKTQRSISSRMKLFREASKDLFEKTKDNPQFLSKGKPQMRSGNYYEGTEIRFNEGDIDKYLVGTVQRVPKTTASFNDLRKGSEIRIDNPPNRDVFTGETYVEKKIRENKEYMSRNPNSGPIGLYEGITGYAQNIKFNPKELINIKGEMGEDMFRMTGESKKGMFNKLDALEKTIKKEGYKPTKIKITVAEDGTPYITEGNHRLAEAFKSNRSEIVADVNYLRGGESVDGPLNPTKIGIGKDAPKSNDASNLNRGGLMARA